MFKKPEGIPMIGSVGEDRPPKVIIDIMHGQMELLRLMLEIQKDIQQMRQTFAKRYTEEKKEVLDGEASV